MLAIYEDYQRNLYYRLYIKRCATALAALLEQLVFDYKTIYDGAKYDEAYDDWENVRRFAEAVVGRESSLATGCRYVDKHYHETTRSGGMAIVTPEVWASCETGEGSPSCPWYLREEQMQTRGSAAPPGRA